MVHASRVVELQNVIPVGGKNAVEREIYGIDLGGVYFWAWEFALWPERIGGGASLP